MKLIWVSDIHLNFLGEDSRQTFYTSLKDAIGDVVIISGDIAESHNVVRLVTEMENAVGKPIYFVLGNHDFYGSYVDRVKRFVNELGYLPKKYIVPLGANTALVGVDGWGDCRNGDYENSRLVMNDWIYIKDLEPAYQAGTRELKKKLQWLADSDAQKLKRRVLKALATGCKKIIVVSHVPPFEDACLYAGRKGTLGGLPFFSSKCLGDTILPIAKKNPQVDFLWLSGHTHSRAKYKPCNNMTVRVARAEYYQPQIEDII